MIPERKFIHIFGVIGIIRLNLGDYLAVVQEAEDIGKIQGQTIFRITKVNMIPLYNRQDASKILALMEKRLSLPFQAEIMQIFGLEVETVSPGANESDYTEDTQIGSQNTEFLKKLKRNSKKNFDGQNFKYDRKILSELSALLETGNFYFSYGYDLTNAKQRSLYRSKSPSQSIWAHLDKRFWFNRVMCGKLLEVDADVFALPIMQGHVDISQCVIENNVFDFILLSRRSCLNTGMRYKKRGIDTDGNVSNFVETEQILICNIEGSAHTISHVQIRGSIPLFWSQDSNHRKPIPKIQRNPKESYIAMKKHFDELVSLYGDLAVINLVEHTGREHIVGYEYEKLVRRLHSPNVIYHAFDVHKECRGMRYENMGSLIEMLEPLLDSGGYYWYGPTGLFMAQKNVVRTNCMDCLDRTNVAQSFISRHVINTQLLRLGLHSYPDRGIGYYWDFEVGFNHAWANNGDAIAVCYTNTNALKGDVTRTGQRRLKGIVNDAANSLLRLYHNYFRDAFRQSILDYIMGKSLLLTLDDNIPDKIEEYQTIVKIDQKKQVDELRQEALNTVKLRVLDPHEMVVTEATVRSLDRSPLTLGILSITEKIFIVTKKYFYTCVYNYQIDKLSQIKRVPLSRIIQIQKGSCYTSKSKVDEINNYGFSIKYQVYYRDEFRQLDSSFRRFDSTKLKQASSDFNGTIYPSKMQSEIFQIASSRIDDSRSSVEKLVAKLASSVLQIPDYQRVPPHQDFVIDMDLTSMVYPAKNAMKKVRNMFASKPNNHI